MQLQVQDTGMGISEEETSRIFTRFFRTQAARQAAIPGVGLGLSITKTIVERHGGRHLLRQQARGGDHVHGDAARGAMVSERTSGKVILAAPRMEPTLAVVSTCY